MVEQIGEELVQLAEERNERLASDRLVDAIQRMKDVIKGLEQAKNEFEAAECPDKDAEVAFLLAHGINVRAVEGDNKENELLSEGTVDCKKNVATMNGPYHDGVRPHGTHLTKRLVEQVSADDFSRIPHTTRARLDLASLNEMIEALNDALARKLSLLNMPIHRLRQEDRDMVYEWKRQATVEELHQEVFIKNDEFRPRLGSRLRIAWIKTGIPCLRTLKLIREVRNKKSLFIVIVKK